MAYYKASEQSTQDYNQMIADLNAARTAASEDIPSEYIDVAEMYKKGGTYGQGLRTEAETIAKSNLGVEQANLVSSGMSSGSAAGAARSRYSRNLTTAYKNIEDTRTDKLATALSAVGAAKAARGERMSSTYVSTANILENINAASKSSDTAMFQAMLGAQTQKSMQAKNLAAQKESDEKNIEANKAALKTSQSFEAEQNALYKANVNQQLTMAKYQLFI